MLNNISLQTRLIVTMVVLAFLISAVGIAGVMGMRASNNSLHEVQAIQIPASDAITSSNNFLSRTRLTLDRVALHPSDANAPATIERAKGFLASADKAWTAFLALPRGDEEAALAKAAGEARATYVDGLKALSKALEAKDEAEIDAYMMKKLTPLFAKYNDASLKLDEYQTLQAKMHFEASEKSYENASRLNMILAGLALVLMAWTCVSLLRAIMLPLRQALTQFDAMARGDLSTSIEITRRDEMGAMLTGLETMRSKLADTVSQVRAGSVAIANATGEIAAGNMNLSQRTESQAGSLEETASSLEELTATVRHNADNVRQANQMAHGASEVAGRGGVLVGQVVDTMGAINESSRKIVDIIGVIDSIAFQTNILALNAAVEAARAGEQGRGFAVVASEVRNLAQRSAAAAQEIKGLITASVAKVEAGGELVGKAGATMDEVVASVAKVSRIMGDIMTAGEEQSAGIVQINQAVIQMDASTQQNAALVEEAAAAAGSLQEQAAALQEVVSIFQLENANASTRALIGSDKARLRLAA